jgi:hypothetical protein
MDSFVNFLTDLLENPLIAGAVVMFLTTLLPPDKLAVLYKSLSVWFERFPILGVILKIVRLYMERAAAAAIASKIDHARETADVLVKGAEQLKKINKIDSATAGAKVTQQLVQTYGLDEETARTVTDAAVRDMNSLRGWQSGNTY